MARARQIQTIFRVIPRKISSGFLLLEALFGLLCLMIFIVSWYHYRVGLIKIRSENQNIFEALIIARSSAEELYATNRIESNKKISKFTISTTVLNDSIFTDVFKRDSLKKGNFRSINITISWQEYHKQKSISFITGASIEDTL